MTMATLIKENISLELGRKHDSVQMTWRNQKHLDSQAVEGDCVLHGA